MNTPAPTTTPPKRRGFFRWLFRARGMAGAPHHLARFVWKLALTGTLLVLILWVIGIPAPWCNRIFDLVYQGPLTFSAQSIRLHPVRGIVLEHLVATDPSQPDRTFTARRGIIRLSHRNLLFGRVHVSEVALHDGTLHTPVPSPREGAPITLIIDQLWGNLVVWPETIELRGMTAQFADLHLILSGSIVRGIEPEVPRDERADVTVLSILDQLPPWLPDLEASLRDLRFETPPRLALQFRLDPDHPAANTATLSGQTGNITFRNRPLGQWTLQAAYTNRTLHLDPLTATLDDRRINLSLTYATTNQNLQARLFTDLPPQRWLSMVPSHWVTNLTSKTIDLDGRFTSEVWIGPCPISDWTRHWNGWISTDQAKLGNLPIHRGFVAGRRRGNLLQLDNINLDVGRDPGRGRVESSITWDLENQRYEGTVTTRLDLNQAADLLPPGLARVIAMSSFQDQPPHFTGSFHGSMTNKNDYRVEGTVTARDIVFRTVPLTSLNTQLRVEPGVVYLEPLHATRETGFVNGNLAIDWRRKRYTVDLEATAPPVETLRMASRSVSDGLSVFHFGGTSLVRAHGVIDGADPEQTALDIHLSASSVDYQWLRADNLIGDWKLRGESVFSTNLVVRLFGGTLHAEVQWATDAANADLPFTASLTVDNVNFRRLVEARRRVNLENEVGLLSGHAELAGSYDHAWRDRLTGHGHLNITEGSLLQIPIFGGLSTLLSAIYPGMGFSDQNAFRASFEVHDGAFHSRDMTVSGNVISLNGRGAYHLIDDLDVVVQVKPLRDGIVADALRVLTLPITKLLEFKLSGPSADPTWRPANLPKELFLQF